MNLVQLTNDVAIVWVRTKYNQSIRFTDYVLPACLPTPEQVNLYNQGDTGFVSGWGLTEEQDRSSAAKKLQYVAVPMTSTSR